MSVMWRFFTAPADGNYYLSVSVTSPADAVLVTDAYYDCDGDAFASCSTGVDEPDCCIDFGFLTSGTTVWYSFDDSTDGTITFTRTVKEGTCTASTSCSSATVIPYPSPGYGGYIGSNTGILTDSWYRLTAQIASRYVFSFAADTTATITFYSSCGGTAFRTCALAASNCYTCVDALADETVYVHIQPGAGAIVVGSVYNHKAMTLNSTVTTAAASQVYFSFTAPSAGSYKVTGSLATAQALTLSAYSGCFAGFLDSCNTTSSSGGTCCIDLGSLASGEVVLIAAAGTPGSTATVSLIAQAGTCATSCGVTCGDPCILTLNSTSSNTTADATSYSGSTYPGVWYKFTATATDTFRFTLCATNPSNFVYLQLWNPSTACNTSPSETNDVPVAGCVCLDLSLTLGQVVYLFAGSNTNGIGFTLLPEQTVCSPSSGNRTALGTLTGAMDGGSPPKFQMPNISITAGDMLVVYAGVNNSTFLDTITSCTYDGDAMTLATGASNDTGLPVAAAIFYLQAASTKANKTIEIRTATNGGTAKVVLAAISLAGYNDIIDRQAKATGSSTSPSSGATATTTVAAEFIGGYVATAGPSSDTAGTWDTLTEGQRAGTTGGAAGTNITISEVYQEVLATAAFTASKTGITSRDWAAGIATWQ